MYLRTIQRKNKDGTVVAYLQLSVKVRDTETKQPVDKVIYSFGRADQIDRGVLARLVQSIARITGQEVSDPLVESEEAHGSAQDPLPAGMQVVETRPFGVVLVAAALWERLGIGSKLQAMARKDGVSPLLERAIFTMVANRLCEPLSKLGVWDRWLGTVHLPDCWDLGLDSMYAAMDLLHAHTDEVEEAVFFGTANLFNLEVDLIFYDTTTCSFAIDDADEEEEGGLRVFGHAKEGGWSPQVVVALAVTKEGFPVRSWVLPGNTSDVTTVEKVRADLRGWKLGRTLFIGDSGMNSEENRAELARACGRYILAMRVGSVAEVKKEVLSRQGRYKVIDENLHAKEVVIGEGERRRRYVLCYNPEQAKREAHHREEVVRELGEMLSEHKGREATAKWAIDLLASKRYGRWLFISPAGKVAIDQKAVREAARLDGKWALLTNDDTLSVEDVATSYKAQALIERCFRALKTTGLKMRPMYHWLSRRIEAHVKICVLALLVERIAEHVCQQPWPRLAAALERLQVTEFRTETHVFFRRNEVPEAASSVLKKLDIRPPKLLLDVKPLPEAL
jgi:hypothetical protein